MGTSNGLKIWCPVRCGYKSRYTTTGTPFKEFPTEGGNVSSSMGSQLTGNLLSMYTPRGGSSLSLSSRLWNGTTISIWIGFRKLSNLTVKEHFAFNVSLRMFTRTIVIQRRVEDL
nr:hypothetical protein [Tanacetum cinerariifolium]